MASLNETFSVKAAVFVSDGDDVESTGRAARLNQRTPPPTKHPPSSSNTTFFKAVFITLNLSLGTLCQKSARKKENHARFHPREGKGMLLPNHCQLPVECGLLSDYPRP